MKNRILIVSARYYADISAALEQGAAAILDKADVDYEIIEVPGALEIPAAISMAATTNHYQGYIALGCVIRGETSHYDIVAGESARGLSDLAIHKLLPMGNGILTVENKQQAIRRADPGQLDKGGFAASSMLSMLTLKTSWGI